MQAQGYPMLKELGGGPLSVEHLRNRLVVLAVLLVVDHLKDRLVVLVVLAVPLVVDHLKDHLVALVAPAVLVVPIVHALPAFVAPCRQNQ